MKKITFLICFLFLFAGTVMAQYSWTPGEIFLKNGKTMSGFVKLKKPVDGIKFGNKIKYRAEKKGKTQKIKEKEAEKVIFTLEDGEIAEFRWMPKNKKSEALYRVLADGKVKLYAREHASFGTSAQVPGTGIAGGAPPMYYSTGGWSYNEVLLLKEGEDTPYPVVQGNILKSFRKGMMEYFSDCPELVQKIDDKVYKRDDLEQIVEDYNNCQ